MYSIWSILLRMFEVKLHGKSGVSRFITDERGEAIPICEEGHNPETEMRIMPGILPDKTNNDISKREKVQGNDTVIYLPMSASPINV